MHGERQRNAHMLLTAASHFPRGLKTWLLLSVLNFVAKTESQQTPSLISCKILTALPTFPVKEGIMGLDGHVLLNIELTLQGLPMFLGHQGHLPPCLCT